jgi:hypothetical protein
MKKVLLAGTLVLATLCGAQAQTTNSNQPTNSSQTTTTTQTTNPTTDGTTKNSGVGNATNGSSSSTGATDSQGAVGANNGTSYGMQSTTADSASANRSDRRKERKAKANKPN